MGAAVTASPFSPPPAMPDADRLYHIESNADFADAFPVIVQLRPHLTLDTFRERVRHQMTQGYRLAALAVDGRLVALGGYRLLDYLWAGRSMYVDDLVTDAASRSRGHGERLLGWLVELATREGCAEICLDSGVHRRDAHRFYFRERMTIEGYHFTRKLPAAATGR